MRVLVNYDKAEAAYLSPLAAMLGEFQMEGLSTKAPSRLDELMYKAQAANVDAIIVCNTETLKNLVPGDKPSLDAWRGSVLRFPIPILIVNSLFHLHSVPYGTWLLS